MSKNVQWNTGRHYGPWGQRITARQNDDGTIVFRDHDRHITGVLTVESTYGGAPSGGRKIFASMDAVAVRRLVDDYYCNGYRYQSARADGLDWHDGPDWQG